MPDCPVCLDTVEPVNAVCLPCLHELCRTCKKECVKCGQDENAELYRAKGLRCPVCRMYTNDRTYDLTEAEKRRFYPEDGDVEASLDELLETVTRAVRYGGRVIIVFGVFSR